MKKNLICYFSATGTTKNIAQTLSSLIGADLFEIEPVNKYTSKDLDWNDKNSRTTIESENESIRPEVKSRVENLDNYENIIIGFPVWWYKEPSIIDTFIEENDLTHKNVHVFVTSGGSSFAGSLKHLKEKYPNINFVSGKTLNSVNSDDVLDWIKK